MATFGTLNMNVSTTISILGCGWLGLPLGKKLSDKGFTVTGSITNQARMELLRKANITPVLINLQETKVPDSFLKTSVLIIAVPKSYIHLEYLHTLLEHAAEHGLKKVILVSSTGIYKDTHTEIAESDGSAINTASKLFAIEELVKSVDQLNPVILRMAGL